MEKEQWRVSGFLFETKAEYEKAAKEQESVDYIKANSNFKDAKSALKVYMNLIEKNIFETVIGYTFMENLRRSIVAANVVPENLVPAVTIKKTEGKPQASDKKHKEEVEKIAHKRSISRYLNIFLVIVVIAMFAISYYSPKNNLEMATKKVQDEYSSWEQQLKERETAVELREKELSK